MGELVSVDGFSLSGPDRGGEWKVLKLDGWWDRPAVKEPPEKRPFGDGSDRVPIRYDERLITIDGRFTADSHERLHEALNQILAVGVRGGVQMVVAGHGTTQTATVDPRAAGVVANIRSDRYVSYMMQLVAPDSFKYGESKRFEVSPGETTMVSHRGTVDAWPTVEITGNMPGYKLRFRGVDVPVTASVDPGETHRVEFRNRRLYVNGQFLMGFFGAANFQPCLPGVRHAFQLIPESGTGQAVMTLTDTYI